MKHPDSLRADIKSRYLKKDEIFEKIDKKLQFPHSKEIIPHKGIILKKSLIKVLKDNLTCEMYHAILDIFDSPHFIIKLHLTVFTTIAYGLACYMTIKLIMNYLNYDVTASIQTLYETPSPFPKVTICNLNPFTTKFAFDFLNSISNLTSMKPMNFYDRSEMLWRILYKAQGFLGNQTNEYKQRMGHQLNDILINCQFNFQKCDSELFWKWDSYYGNCFIFNMGQNATGQKISLKHSDLAGFSFGLKLDLYVNYYEGLDLFNSILGGKGAMIRIDNVTHMVDHGIDGIFVSTGMATNLILKREIKKTLRQPYSNCLIDNGKESEFQSALFNKIKESSYDYTQQFCFQQCLQHLVMERCNCVIYRYVTVINAKICTAPNETECAIYSYDFIYGKNDYITLVCLPQCPLECNSTRIAYKTTSYKLSGSTYLDYIKNNENILADFSNRSIISKEQAQESVVRLFVYYDSLSYEHIEEAPQIDLVSLIASIGGNLGLFLGVSLFSLCEMMTTLLEIYFYKKSVP